MKKKRKVVQLEFPTSEDTHVGEDLCMAYRYQYYVLAKPLVRDLDYDKLEREVLEEVGENSPLRKPGSENKESYEPRIRALSLYLLLTFGEHKVTNKEKPPEKKKLLRRRRKQ